MLEHILVVTSVYAIRGLISKPHIGQTIRVIAIVGDLKKNSDINKTKRFVRQMTPWLSG